MFLHARDSNFDRLATGLEMIRDFDSARNHPPRRNFAKDFSRERRLESEHTAIIPGELPMRG